MNHLLIILDSVSYDVFQKAKAKNIRKLGEIGKAYTPAHWTLPSIISMFHIPFYMGKPLMDPTYNEPHIWLPDRMKQHGYNTALISDSPWFTIYKEFISRGFDNYAICNRIDTEWVIKESIKHLIPPFFTVVWITETHHGDHLTKELQTIEHKINAIEKVDKLLESLFEKIPSNTRTVVTADHGDIYNDMNVIIGHDPHNKMIRFDEDLFKVFFVMGQTPSSASTLYKKQ